MRKLSSSFLLTSVALAVSTAFAAEKEATEVIPQVMVTAQKRAQTEMDVPQSISVVDGSVLEKMQATSFADYLKLVPGLQLNQATPGEGRIALRGINTGGVASTVAVYLDETPFGSSSGLANGAILAGDFDTFDLQRVEVLRGPQGALYGASSLGGLLKFVTNAPETDRFIFRARAGMSKVDGGGIGSTGNLVVNAPISDTMAFRASGSFQKTPGFIDSIGSGGSDVQNNINTARTYSARASLLITPSKDFSLRLSALNQNIKADTPSEVESDPLTLKTLYGSMTQSQFVAQMRSVDYKVYNGTVNWNLGSASLTSSTSFARQEQARRIDYTLERGPTILARFGTPNETYQQQATNLKKFTQELRLSSNQSARLEWLAGVYFTDEDGLIRQGLNAVTPGTMTPISGLPSLSEVSLTSTYKEIAGFGNVTAHLNETYDIDLGARYSHNKQDERQTTAGALVASPVDFVANSAESVATYSFAPKMKLSKNATLYTRVAKGYRPGGPNVLPPAAPPGTPTTYQSDSVLSYELGVKARTSDGRFGVDLAAFHIKWKDIQLFQVVNNYGVNVNGASAQSDGLELTATVRPVRGLSISVNGTYNNAHLAGDSPAVAGGMPNDKLPFSPKLSTGTNAAYRWMVGDTTTAFAGASLRHVGEQSGGFDAAYRAANGHQRQLPSYNVIDMQVGVEFGRWTLEAYGKNLANSEGKTSTNTGKLYPKGAFGTGVLTPRTIGLMLTAEY